MFKKNFFFTEKTFFKEKNINGNITKIYPFDKCFYTENFCFTNKYKSFLSKYSFCRKN